MNCIHTPESLYLDCRDLCRFGGLLLAVQGDRHPNDAGSGMGKDVDGLPNGGPGGDHIIHDEHSPLLDCRPYQLPALA